MKRNIFIVLILLIATQLSWSQATQTTDSISMVKVFGGYKFMKSGERLTMHQLNQVMMDNEEAYLHYKKAKTNYGWGAALSFAGGFMVGWPLGTALAGGEPNWALAGIGAGLITISIPLNQGFNKHARKAVGVYNKSAVSQSSLNRPKLNFALNSAGIGIRLLF